MKYTRGQFTNEYYQLWQMGLLISTPPNSSVYSVKYRKNQFDEYSRVTLKAISVNDALERACYAITYASPWRPEDIDLHAVYDNEENLLWIDEPFYDLVQKKNEFRGMERREFLVKFGMTSAAILFGLRSVRAGAATTGVNLSGAASGFIPTGEQMYTTPGSYSWTVPTSVTSCCVVCVGGGGASGPGYGSGSAGGGLGYTNSISVTPGSSISVIAGAGGAAYSSVPTSNGQTSQFGTSCYGYGGGSGLSGSAPSGGSYSGTGGGSGGAGGVYVSTGGYGGGSGGGGAGGYSGNGGQGGSWAGSSVGPGATGAGGGGGGGGGGNAGNGGGGVGLYGQGSSGAGGSAGGWYDYNAGSGGGPSSTGGGGGSGGTSATSYGGGAYGGGTCSATAVPGASGAVRIIWGSGRSFPNNAT